MKNIVISNCSGMLSSYFIELYHNKYNIIGISKNNINSKLFKNFYGSLEEYKFVIDSIQYEFGEIDCFINNCLFSYCQNPCIEPKSEDLYLNEIKKNILQPYEISCYLCNKYWFSNPSLNKEKKKQVINIGNWHSKNPINPTDTFSIITAESLKSITCCLSNCFSELSVRFNCILTSKLSFFADTKIVCNQIDRLIEEDSIRNSTIEIESSEKIKTVAN